MPGSDGGIITAAIDTPLGALTAGARHDGICLLAFPGTSGSEVARVCRRFGCGVAAGDSPHLIQLRRELDAYFDGGLKTFTVPLVLAGTPFQERVWAALREIPYGVTRSYEELSLAVGANHAQRAVGHANGRNPIAIVVPCHRVINKNGQLGGYGGELWRKQALLRLESGSRLLGFES